MLEQTAVAFENLRKFDEAQKLREAALALRKEAGSAQYAEGLVKLAELAKKRNANDAAVNFYVQAVQVGDMAQTATALLNLGMDAAFRDRDSARAMEYFQRARNAARTPDDTGRAMTWMAYLQQQDPAHAAEAEALYRSALSIEEQGSSAQALTSDMLARLLRIQERTAEAEFLETSAAIIHKKLAATLSPQFEASVSSAMRVGGGVLPPKLLYKVEPAYSDEARAVKTAGTVLLNVVIDVDGQAKDIRVEQGVGMGLDEKAVEAVRGWRFKPGEMGGAPVPVQARIEVNFRLM
jgi:TonB family protein